MKELTEFVEWHTTLGGMITNEQFENLIQQFKD